MYLGYGRYVTCPGHHLKKASLKWRAERFYGSRVKGRYQVFRQVPISLQSFLMDSPVTGCS